MIESKAPVAIFVYRRLDHTKRTIEALANNAEATSTDVVVFSDGAKDASVEHDVIAVRNYLKTMKGFRSVQIVERDCNHGLSKSIISGVSTMLEKHDRVIVLEDDLVTSPFFLKYMNEALALYGSDPRVACIHGYAYPLNDDVPETYFLKGADCWGWATWRHSWKTFNPDGEMLLAELKRRQAFDEFDFKNHKYFTSMLEDQINGRNDSWAIRWYASAFLSGKFTLYPRHSLVANIGLDGSGSHCSIDDGWDVELAKRPILLTKVDVVDNVSARQAWEKYFTKTRSVRRRAINKISRTFNHIRHLYGR